MSCGRILLAEGDLYPGDLLNAVLREDELHTNVEQWQMVEEIASGLLSAVQTRDPLTEFRHSTFPYSTLSLLCSHRLDVLGVGVRVQVGRGPTGFRPARRWTAERRSNCHFEV